MGHHANFSAQLPLAADHPFNPREGSGDMRTNIYLPALIFIHQLLLGEAEPLSAHVRESKVIAAIRIFLQGDVRARAEFI